MQNVSLQNAKCKMATDSGWRNIADFKLHKMQILTNQNLNELYFPWFLGYRTKTFRNWKMDCNFVINRKKTFLGVKIWAAFLNVPFSIRSFTEILRPFPKKRMLFSKAIYHWKPSSFYLPNLKKILWDISNNTEKAFWK